MRGSVSVHRGSIGGIYAGLTKPLFMLLSSLLVAFECPHCVIYNQNRCIDDLKQSVDKLANNLELVKLELSTQAKGPLSTTSASSPRSVKKSSSSSSVHRKKGNQASQVVSQDDDSSRKFNVVMYGVPEPASRTSRNTFTAKDCQSVVSSAESADITVSVCDWYCLGRFSKDRPKPRPLLVKLNSVSDVITILKAGGSLKNECGS